MYCEKCCRVIEENRCPACGSKKVRMPEAKDPCFLTELDYMPSGILEDVLKQNAIPYLKKDMLGAGMTIRLGPMLLERSRFYVPYEKYQEAKDITDAVFSDAEEEAEPVTE